MSSAIAAKALLRGAKRMLWEGGHRVPFIAWGPGRVPAGQTEREIICLTDLMAAIANLTGYKLSNESAEDSTTLDPRSSAKKRQNPIRPATVHHSMNNEYGLRQGDWVLIESPKSAHGAAEPAWWRERFGIQPHDQPGELFHLKEDLGETKNLYKQYPDRVRQCTLCWSVTKMKGAVRHADENANVRGYSAYLLGCRVGRSCRPRQARWPALSLTRPALLCRGRQSV